MSCRSDSDPGFFAGCITMFVVSLFVLMAVDSCNDRCWREKLNKEGVSAYTVDPNAGNVSWSIKPEVKEFLKRKE